MVVVMHAIFEPFKDQAGERCVLLSALLRGRTKWKRVTSRVRRPEGYVKPRASELSTGVGVSGSRTVRAHQPSRHAYPRRQPLRAACSQNTGKRQLWMRRSPL